MNAPTIATLFAVNAAATTLSNDDGSIFALSSIDFDLGNDADYTIMGTIETAGHVNIVANNIVNQGNITANDYILLNAANNFDNGSANSDNSNIKLSSGNSLNIIAANLINNYATLSSETNLTLTSTNGSINNNSNGKIIGGDGVTTLSAFGGDINQNSSNSLVANGDLVLSAVNLNNAGRIDVANDLTTNLSGNLTNSSGALIYAGQDMILNVANTLTNNIQAAIFAERNLTVRKDNTNAKTLQLNNISAEITAYAGNMSLYATTLNNKRSDNKVQGSETRWSSGCNYHNWECHYDSYASKTFSGTEGLAASINAGGKINITANTLVNDASNINAVDDIVINATNFNNNSQRYESYNKAVYDWWGGCGQDCQLNSAPPKNYLFESYLSSIKSGGLVTVNATNNISNEVVTPNFDPSLINSQIVSQTPQTVNSLAVGEIIGNGTIDVNIVQYLNGPDNQGLFTKNPNPNSPLFETRSEFLDQSRFFGSDYFYARIGLDLADVQTQFEQQNQRLVGDQFFQTKIIEEQLRTISKNSYLLSANETNVNNEVQSLLNNAADEYARLGLSANTALTQTQINSLTKDIVWFETQTIEGQVYIVPKIYLTQATRDNLAGGALADKSMIFAAGDINLTSTNGQIVNDGSIVGANVTLAASGDIVNRNFSNITSSNALALSSAAGSISNFSQISAGKNLNLTSNGGNITNSGSIGSGGNTTLTATKDIDNKGDLFATNKLLLDAGGDVSISASSTPSHFKLSSTSLQDDAETARANSIFNAGTDIQINSGGTINIATSYLQAGGSIYMSATDDINNSNYTIKADNDVVMSATNINNIHTQNNDNETRIEGGGLVSLDASNDINNIGATIKSGTLLYMTAGNDINNTALVDYKINGQSATESQALASNSGNIRSNLISQGNLISSGDMVLVAGNDINNTASNITATGSGYIEATNGNVNINTAALRNRTYSEGGNKKHHWVNISDNTTNVQSDVNFGGSLDVVASGTAPLAGKLADEIGNINITGSDITITDNLTLTAKNDITIQSAQDKSYSFAAGRLGKGRSYLNQNSSTTQIASDITTTNNGNISINSGVGNLDVIGADNATGSIAIIASNLTTKDNDNNALNNVGDGNISLVAKEDVVIASALNTNLVRTISGKKTNWIKKSHNEMDFTATNISSNLIASGNVSNADNAGDINITSGSNTAITASNLSGENGNLLVGKYVDTTDDNAITINDAANLTIQSGQNYHRNETTDMKIKKDAGAVAVGAVVAVAVVVATGGAGAIAVGGAILGGGMAGGQAQRGRTITNINEDVIQASSNLTFNNNLNIQSASDTTITASNLTANTATILTGKFRDQNTLIEIITDTNAELNINSAFDTHTGTTTIHQVKPNYAGVALVAAAETMVGVTFSRTYNPLIGFIVGGAYSNGIERLDPYLNIRVKNTYHDSSQAEIQTDLHFNNLTIE